MVARTVGVSDIQEKDVCMWGCVTTSSLPMSTVGTDCCTSLLDSGAVRGFRNDNKELLFT